MSGQSTNPIPSLMGSETIENQTQVLAQRLKYLPYNW